MIKTSSYRKLPVSVWKDVPFWLRVRHHYLRYYTEIYCDVCQLFDLSMKELMWLCGRILLSPVAGLLSALVDNSLKDSRKIVHYTTYNIHPKLIDYKWYNTEYSEEETSNEH